MTEIRANFQNPQLQTPVLGSNTRIYALMGALFGALFPIFAISMSLTLNRLPLTLVNLGAIHRREPLLWIIDTAPLFLGIFAALAGYRQDTLTARNRDLQERERELTEVRGSLEQRVEKRTQQLSDNNLQMQAAVRLTRALADIHEMPSLLSTAADMLANIFKPYAASIYLLDRDGRRAVLAAASATGRDILPAQGHTVSVGDESLVGRAAAQIRILMGGSESATGEPRMAFPLVARGRMLGVLAMYAASIPEGQETNTQLLELLADQTAAAMDATRLMQETQSALRQLEDLSGVERGAGWQEFAGRGAISFHYTPAGIRQVSAVDVPEDAGTMRVPLTLRGQRIGSIALRRGASKPWSEEDRDLAQNAANQAALALENVRLLEETRQRAVYEQKLSEISSRFSSSIDVDTLLQTAVRELAALPEVADASIFINPPADASGAKQA